MFTGALIVVLLLCAVIGTAYLVRLRRERKFEAECKKAQDEYRIKQLRDREDMERLLLKLKEEPHSTVPSMVVDYIDLDEEGRNLFERFTSELPPAPEQQLYSADLKPIDCPEFIAYKIRDKADAA